eukprot:SAG11_NODE_116_length_16002_cov_19.164560_25_plen_99_part_00
MSTPCEHFFQACDYPFRFFDRCKEHARDRCVRPASDERTASEKAEERKAVGGGRSGGHGEPYRDGFPQSADPSGFDDSSTSAIEKDNADVGFPQFKTP